MGVFGIVTMLVVELTDEAGVTHQVKSGGGSSRAPELGTRLRLAYDPADPKKALIERDVRLGARVGLICVIVFLPVLVASAVGMVLIPRS